MKILKRTTGIDFKSEKSHLKGSVELLFKDAHTGKLLEKVKGQNDFTVALDSVLNKVPYGFNQRIYNNIDQSIPYQSPINKTALGGLILFPQDLGSDLTDLYPDFTNNYPTGYAAIGPYQQDDPKLGIFDQNSSGEVSNGYKNVYYWGSAFGNEDGGYISAAALSGYHCYKYFNDLANITPVGHFRQSLPGAGGFSLIIGANSKGFYTVDTGVLDQGHINFYKYPISRIDINFDINNISSVQLGDFEFQPADHQSAFCVQEDYINIFLRTSYSAPNSTIKWTKISTADGSVTTSTFTVAADVLPAPYLIGDVSNRRFHYCGIRNGYLYLPKADHTAVIKIDLSNPVNIAEIAMPSGYDCYAGTSVCGNKIIAYYYSDGQHLGYVVIGDDDVARASGMISNDSLHSVFLYQHGVWSIRSYSQYIYADILSPYAATKFNFGETYQKTIDKQLICNYIVTQE